MSGLRSRTFVRGVGEVAADAPVAAADDPGLRGDGFFETLLVRDGIVRLHAHLDRFERSAAAFGVRVDRREWTGIAEAVTDAVPPGVEAALRLTVARGGVEFATVRPVPASVLRGRAGVRALTLPRGTATVPDAPWLLAAAKTSSYAVNSAALREAARRGADDAVFVDAGGFVLEAPTANVLWRRDGRWRTPPQAGRAVLPGTTLAAVAAQVEVTEVPVRPGELLDGEGVWLLSSLRGAAPLRALDGRAVSVDEDATALLAGIALGTRCGSAGPSSGGTIGG
ncbi:aminotransferase class IV [Kineococcus sp. SYSU DK001]|uniref:aminotransferase class IV n=1 Tax=Kineococcus sp. SYSU DK001 TaxID=3383122 RepID=UPI003D7C52F0